MHSSAQKKPELEPTPELHTVTEIQPRRHAWLRLIGICGLIATATLAAYGIFERSQTDAALSEWTQERALPNVAIVSPLRGVEGQELVLPGNIEAKYEAPIHARVSGYLKMWYKDIGAQVKAGDLLAEIDTPDLDQQLMQAKADLASAQANEKLADLTAKRWKAMLGTHAVAEQVVDEKIGDAEARQAQTAAAQANVQRLEALEEFKRITAPFDGIVTARKTDVGALINAGGDNAPELFSVADTSKMRVYVHVPQALSGSLKQGMEAKLKLPQYPDQTFTATLETTSNAVDQASRAVLAEFVADNADGKLWPGTYAEAHLQLPASPDILHIPTTALLFRQNGMKVAVLDGDSNKVKLLPVTLGRDLGTQVEILSGLESDAKVIDSPPDSLEDGDAVTVASSKTSVADAGSGVKK